MEHFSSSFLGFSSTFHSQKNEAEGEGSLDFKIKDLLDSRFHHLAGGGVNRDSSHLTPLRESREADDHSFGLPNPRFTPRIGSE